MAEFDDKLGQILSNPEAMAQIARLAQSLNAPPSGNPPPVGNVPPAGNPPPVGNVPPSGNPPPGNAPPVGNVPPTPPAPVPPPPHGAPGAAPPASGTDADSISRFLPLLQELGGDSDARRLLYALRPYLRPRKQEKVERALHLARLFRVGKKFLSQWEG